MAVLADDELVRIREYVPWSPPTDDDIFEKFDTLGDDATWAQTARAFVLTKRQELLANPSSFSVGGEYSESWGENIRALNDSLGTLDGLIAVETAAGQATVARLVRADRAPVERRSRGYR